MLARGPGGAAADHPACRALAQPAHRRAAGGRPAVGEYWLILSLRGHPLLRWRRGNATTRMRMPTGLPREAAILAASRGMMTSFGYEERDPT
ncbi:MAG: hypothetical protein Q4P43_07630 [Corynebacterium sphenisci]|nr:hypothetical protein [Corynebacterium sphenisci]